MQTSLINIPILDTRIKNVLESWLKFGTVFLVFWIFSYYFLRKDENAPLIDSGSTTLALLILLGFTFYYLLVEPYVPINLKHPVLQSVGNDTLMFGTVLLVSHLIESYLNGGSMFNEKWIYNAGLILLAFATYRVVIFPFIPVSNLSLQTRPVVNDIAQFGIFLIAFRLFRGESLTDKNWMMSVLFVLLGFVGYHYVTKQVISFEPALTIMNQNKQ